VNHELVDICFNFTHKSFRADEAEVMERAGQAGIRTMIVTGSSVEDTQTAIQLAEHYPARLAATAGVHPHLASGWTHDTRAELRSLAANPTVKAIGEAGLDYNRNYSPRDAQRTVFEQQIELACDLKLPLFLHLRDAQDDFLTILSRYRGDFTDAVVHCFTGGAEELDGLLEMDLHVGITGWICDERRGSHLLALLPRIPSDRLMIETDAPYLTPRDLKPQPKARRNEPAFLPHILVAVAGALGHSAEAVAEATTANARRFFRLDVVKPIGASP
jgi:TatD DNase family protein